MKYYKLIDAMTSPVSFNLPYEKDGRKIYQFYQLYPGEKYTEHIDDPLFVEALRSANKRIAYSPEKEQALKDCGARYEVKSCKSCGGRVKKIDVWLVEVVE